VPRRASSSTTGARSASRFWPCAAGSTASRSPCLHEALDRLADHGPSRLLLDCSQLRHIDYRLVPQLVDGLSRFESRAGGFVVCGLSRYLRDLFRLAGCEPRVRCWPSASELLDAALEPDCGRAS
jgi:hypothetical protein